MACVNNAIPLLFFHVLTLLRTILISASLCFFKQGYEYVQKPGECCGHCIQTSCALKIPGFDKTMYINVR